IASDVDFLLSLSDGGNLVDEILLKDAYDGLYNELRPCFQNVRKQNVSIRIELQGSSLISSPLEVDITPARKRSGNTNDHSLYVSKKRSWKKTIIQQHINDVKYSGRTNDIKLLKIWRQLYDLDFP